MVTERRKALRIEPFVNPPENLKNLLSINRRFCVECGNVPTQIAYFDVGESILTERYCDNCIKTVNIGWIVIKCEKEWWTYRQDRGCQWGDMISYVDSAKYGGQCLPKRISCARVLLLGMAYTISTLVSRLSPVSILEAQEGRASENLA